MLDIVEFVFHNDELFHVAHSLYTARKIRASHNGLEYSRRNPFSALIGFLFINFAGTISVSFLLGQTPSFLKDNFQILSATAVWLVMFFDPTEFVPKLIETRPFLDIAVAFEGSRLAYKAIHYSELSLRLFPYSMTTAFFASWLSICSSSFVFYYESLLRTNHYEFPLHKPTWTMTLTCASTLAFLILVVPGSHLFSPLDILHVTFGLIPKKFFVGLLILAFTFELWASVVQYAPAKAPKVKAH